MSVFNFGQTQAEVDGYRIGDDVMGAFRFSGADSEYAVVRLGDRHTAVSLKPPSVSPPLPKGVLAVPSWARGLFQRADRDLFSPYPLKIPHASRSMQRRVQAAAHGRGGAGTIQRRSLAGRQHCARRGDTW
jgi:hypothetical protein